MFFSLLSIMKLGNSEGVIWETRDPGLTMTRWVHKCTQNPGAWHTWPFSFNSIRSIILALPDLRTASLADWFAREPISSPDAWAL